MNDNFVSQSVPIPPFDSEGYLPVGVHPATLAEVRARFGGGSVRARQFEELDELYRVCCIAGIDRMVLAGSFVSQKEQCADLDGILFGPEAADWALILEHLATRSEGLDFLIATDASMLRALEELFSRRKEGGRRGLIEIPTNKNTVMAGKASNRPACERVLDYQITKFQKLKKEAGTEMEGAALAMAIGELEKRKA